MALIISKLRLILLFNFISISIFAGVTGKIAGRITDSETGEPLAYANVAIVSNWIDGESIN